MTHTNPKLQEKTLIRKENPLTWSVEQHVNDLNKFIEMYRKQQKDLGGITWSVCGEDTRSEIRKVNENSSNILRATCHLAITYEKGLGACTGFFVGPRKIVTAAHCLYERYNGFGHAVKVIARPGLHRDCSGDIVPPFLGDFGDKVIVPDDWIENGNYESDYGLITLASDELFNKANEPFFTLLDADDDFLEKYSSFNCYGYPDLAPFPNQCFYRDEGEPITIVTRHILYSKIDTSQGNSGGPLSFGGDMAVGICSHHSPDCSPPNGFTRITTSVKREIEDYPTLTGNIVQ